MEQRILQLEQKIQELQNEVMSLKNASTISFENDMAFRSRFKLDTFATTATNLSNSTKVATSENQSVNEAGASTYSVLKSPDAFLETTVAGAIKYIPIYT